MKNPAWTPFATIFQNEVRLKSKRIAPYLMALLCAGNALLWWGWGPATGRGWAVNSDFFIAGALPVYSFMTLPLFTALFMADPVSSDFRAGVDPLIFSKPISRAAYLLGKFFGNFAVLVCCQSAFVLTWFALQAVHKPGVVTQDVTVVPYIKHFFVFVVISHLVLASFYFAVGALTRSPKIVYGLGISFYPLYISYQTVFLKSLPSRWRKALDPLLMNWGKINGARSAEVVNQLVITYDSALIVNRAMMILVAAICLTILYVRFAIAERPGKVEKFLALNLSTATEGVYYPESSPATHPNEFEKPDYRARAIIFPVALREVARVNEGIRADVNKLIAALGVEFRLLRAERSLVVILPLAIFFSLLEVAFYDITPAVSYSAAYATNTAKLLMLFLLGMTVFYTGEAMHRDREVRIETVLWAAPSPNNVLLLSKFLSTLLLMCGLIFAVGITALAIQVSRNHTPIDLLAYFRVYGLILLPNTIFVTSVAVLTNIALRNKHVAYVFSIGTAVGLFYLYSTGYNQWLYNPVLHGLWTYPDLAGAGNNQATILIHRIYCLGIAIACLSLAHLFFRRRSTKGFWVEGHFTGKGWSILLALLSLTTVIITGRIISSMH
jgi:ABC-type transport system involved in multi-copper enzyme maturation permease subunit